MVHVSAEDNDDQKKKLDRKLRIRKADDTIMDAKNFDERVESWFYCANQIAFTALEL